IIVLLAAVAACCNAAKPQPVLEKCAEQLFKVLPKESNAVVKDAILKIVKHVQNGSLAEAQKIVRGFEETERNALIKKYMVDECLPMQSCLECPVEL
ncbi:hypothetical protein PFISCL1PPCAC_14150, partial [Pristionchus fissidentatus]